MNAMEVIRHRRSVRTFNGDPLREEDARHIIEAAAEADNPYDIPVTWKLLNAEKYGLGSPVIVGADTFIAGKMKRVPHAEEAFGYSFEKIVLEAEKIGLGTTWIAGTMDRPAFERAMELADGEVMPCISPLGYPAEKMSIREAMMRRGVKADSRLPFHELFFADVMSEEMHDILEMVRRAPSAVNKQPWRVVIHGNKAHFYENKSRGFVGETGWDLQKIDMGIAMYHFVYAASEYGYSTELEISDPHIAAFSGAEYTASFVFEK